ncbi:MAG: amidohydrolase family protein [Actinobacteria bacterium]|nr:amidohydrolase family protein [Actinomycetota bacterium]
MNRPRRILIENCEAVATMDPAGTEIAGGSILIEDGVIVWVGSGRPDEGDLDLTIDGRGSVALPGLINTHLHLYQTLLRGRAQEGDLTGWLIESYRLWAELVDEEWSYHAALVGLGELALSGCTLTSDHHHVHPPGRGNLIEATIKAASEIGLRFHPVRGSIDLGESDGAIPPDRILEHKDDALAASKELVERYHDRSPGSMLQIAIGPCWQLNCSEALMRESAELARDLEVRLHTHAAEPVNEEELTLALYGRRPIDYLDGIDMLGSDVWLAHCVQLSDGDIARMAATGTGVAHCPSSNLRSGAGIAPVHDLLAHGVDVALGVDSLALNDTGSLIGEARQALLAARAGGLDQALTARTALRLATTYGARVLGRDDLGSLEPGKRADIGLYDVNSLEFVGAEHDLVAATVLCHTRRVKHLLVEGREVVRDARLVTVDEEQVAIEARDVARRAALA